MKGTISTYLPEKQYGFIKGEDGKDYFFHETNSATDPHQAPMRRRLDQLRSTSHPQRIQSKELLTPLPENSTDLHATG